MASKIEWTEETWNPVRGCSKVSDGCRNCYAMRQAHRFSGPGKAYEGLTKLVPGKGPQWTGEIRCVEELLEAPLRWKKPRKVFVNSMSDLFHPDVPFEFVDGVFGVMAVADRHVFQVLTKRPERMREYMQGRDWGHAANWAVNRFVRQLDGPLHLRGEVVPPLPNVWLGVSVEDQETADERIPHLLQTPAAVRWLSMEPLLGAVDLCFAATIEDGLERHPFPCFPRDVGPTNELHWVVAGGESGPGARPMHPEWVRSIRDQCQAARVPFFFKQWGAWWPAGKRIVENKDMILFGRDAMYRVGKKHAGRELDGRTWDEYPENGGSHAGL